MNRRNDQKDGRHDSDRDHLRVVHYELIQQSLLASQPEKQTTEGRLKFNSLAFKMFYAEHAAVHNIIEIVGKRSGLGHKKDATGDRYHRWKQQTHAISFLPHR